VCAGAPEKDEGYMMAWTQDDEAFERIVAQRNIAFRVHDRRAGSELPGAE
jgi:hypothetical protein